MHPHAGETGLAVGCARRWSGEVWLAVFQRSARWRIVEPLAPNHPSAVCTPMAKQSAPVRSTLAWRRVHLDPRDVGASGCTVSTAGHEIDVTDLVHAAQVRVIDFQLYDDPLRIELEPALIVERHLGHHEIARETLRSHHPPLWALECLAAGEQLAVGKLHDRMQHVQILRAGPPAHPRQPG